MRDELNFIGFMATVIIAATLLLFTMLGVCNRISLPGELAKIEQLRMDVKRVASASNEDIIGQVTMWNQKIKSNQVYNEIWYADLIIPDKWDDVEIISMPE